jgi:hypothetical protein
MAGLPLQPHPFPAGVRLWRADRLRQSIRPASWSSDYRHWLQQRACDEIVNWLGQRRASRGTCPRARRRPDPQAAGSECVNDLAASGRHILRDAPACREGSSRRRPVAFDGLQSTMVSSAPSGGPRCDAAGKACRPGTSAVLLGRLLYMPWRTGGGDALSAAARGEFKITHGDKLWVKGVSRDRENLRRHRRRRLYWLRLVGRPCRAVRPRDRAGQPPSADPPRAAAAFGAPSCSRFSSSGHHRTADLG